ncbi:MAG: TRAM domain-containing protein, partial [Parachlamydiaceae bacterium]
ISQTGEQLEVKIQRNGKDLRQGVGYLDDGTMVVVNGGAEFMGQTVRVTVLSVKHTSSGRLIFSNVIESEDRLISSYDSIEAPRQYFLKETSYS